MTFPNFINKLQSSSWSSEHKKVLSDIAPKLGPRLLGFLSLSVRKPKTDAEQLAIINVVKLIAGWYELLQKNNSKKIVDQLLDFWSQTDHALEIALFYGVMDIRANTALSYAIPTDLSRLFSLIQCVYFEKMLMKEIVQLLKDRAVSVASFADLSEEVKRYYYLLDLTSEQVRKLKTALEANTEEIGTEPLLLSKGTVRPGVANWLKAFGEFHPTSGLNSTYNIAYFATKHPSASKLPEMEKSILADLLRLYAWILRPEVFPNEIEHFEEERLPYYDSIKKDLITIASENITTQTPSSVDAIAVSDGEGVVVKSESKLGEKMGGIALDTRHNNADASQVTPFSAPEPSISTNESLGLDSTSSGLGGLVMDEGTNVEINVEAKRLQAERHKQMRSIQSKLEELRKRNNLN